MRYLTTILAALALCAATTNPGHALLITPETDAAALMATLTAGGTGMVVTGVTLSGRSKATGETSSGTYTNASGTYGIGNGVILSTGNVSDYGDGPNNSTGKGTEYDTGLFPFFPFIPGATLAQQALLGPITGVPPLFLPFHSDVTQLDITFNVLPRRNKVVFDLVFGSEEFPEHVGSLFNSFNDGFGAYLNGVNIALSGGLPVNINHPDMAPIVGTELDGILTPGGIPLLHFSTLVGEGSTGNILTFILADAPTDADRDTTVYLAKLNAVPEPGTFLLFGSGLVGLVVATRWGKRGMKR